MWIIWYAAGGRQGRFIGPFGSRRDAESWAKKIRLPGDDGDFLDPDLASRIRDGEIIALEEPFVLS